MTLGRWYVNEAGKGQCDVLLLLLIGLYFDGKVSVLSYPHHTDLALPHRAEKFPFNFKIVPNSTLCSVEVVHDY